MRIDPTCRLIIQQKRYLVDLQVGPILIFVRGCKRPGLQPGCNKFFSHRSYAQAAPSPLHACIYTVWIWNGVKFLLHAWCARKMQKKTMFHRLCCEFKHCSQNVLVVEMYTSKGFVNYLGLQDCYLAVYVKWFV
jgi:hypothetical protein